MPFRTVHRTINPCRVPREIPISYLYHTDIGISPTRPPYQLPTQYPYDNPSNPPTCLQRGSLKFGN
ncbi:hypothetical protein B9Z19DRAFT_1077181 [Tuber borchii]|uniref:Uncharacterized protein n=1 Tax=Tuber borchii TaxID=42251 RepID=A0A2T7A101_TUBBO|nr:hypothetical protein B9Z19DRAFT_1077181 [Tuber borchii]